MIVMLFFTLVLSNTRARPMIVSNLVDVVITNYERTDDDFGQYSYTVFTSDGQERKETREVINPETEFEAVIVYGYFAYYAPDGKRIEVSYVADSNGFRAEGEHLLNSADAIKSVAKHSVANCIESDCIEEE